MITKRTLLGALATAPFTLHAARAQPAWPSKPLRVLVGFPGGSTPDLVARVLAEGLAKALGQPVVIENKPGASGNIAADLVAKSSDEHTVGIVINGNLTVAKLLNPANPFDPAKDFAPVSLLTTAPLVLVTAGAAPAARRPSCCSGPRASARRATTARPAMAPWATSAWSCSRARPASPRCTCRSTATRRSSTR